MSAVLLFPLSEPSTIAMFPETADPFAVCQWGWIEVGGAGPRPQPRAIRPAGKPRQRHPPALTEVPPSLRRCLVLCMQEWVVELNWGRADALPQQPWILMTYC